MLFFSRWKAISVLLTAIVICLFAVPNFFPDRVVQRWAAWAQRHIVLGLDLQGGSHLLLEVDSNAVRKEKVQALLDDVRRVLREARIGYTGLVARGESVEVRIREGGDPQLALAKLRELSQPIGGVLGGGGQRTVESAEQALQGQPPPDSEILKDHNRAPYLIQKRVMVSGEDLTDAQPGFDQRTSEPIVTFRFNSNGARRFAQVTQENVGRPFAIVLDNEVISAPVIREPILGGSGQI